MKLLLIIALFVTVNGMAQDKIENIVRVYNGTGTIKEVNTSPLRVGTVVLADSGAVRNATFAEELLFLLQDYETECYNDSTYVEYWQYHESPSYTDSITGASFVYTVHYSPTTIKEWQHKEPTFKGFIEWLKNK